MNETLKQKTTWTGIIAVIGAIGGFLSGEIILTDAIQIALTGLIGIFLRQGIAKTNTI
jgi:hypothetical protein